MFTASFIQSLKRTNISTDADKTRQRTEAIWKAASNADKRTVQDLAGLTRASILRVYKEGSISAKVIVPFANVLKVDPLYLTGEADERGECTEAALRALLVRHGYEQKLDELDKALDIATVKKPRKTRKSKTDVLSAPIETAVEQVGNAVELEIAESAVCIELTACEDYVAENAVVETAAETIVETVADVAPATLETLSEDDMILLLRAMMLREKAGAPGATAQMARLQQLLLS